MDDAPEPWDEEIYCYRLLLECEHSNRVVECECEVQALQSLLEEEVQKIVGANVELVFDVAEYQCTTAKAKGYLLQRFSSEWNEYVDVIDAIEIGTKDKLRAVPMKAKSDTKMVLFY